MRHDDQSCDRASLWTSVACVYIRSGSCAAWTLCLLHASLNWMSRASPCRRVSFSSLSSERLLSLMCLLTARRASPGWLSRERHRAGYRACLAMLVYKNHIVARRAWLVCKIPLLARAHGLKAVAARPSARVMIGYLVFKRLAYGCICLAFRRAKVFCIQSHAGGQARHLIGCQTTSCALQDYLKHPFFMFIAGYRLLLNDVLAKQWHSHPQIHINIELYILTFLLDQ